MKEFNKDIKLKQLKLKHNKNKYIKYTSIILSCVILLVGIIYFTFAKFESKSNAFTLIHGKLGDYTSGDLTIGVNVNGSNVNDFPENNGGYVLTKIECSDSLGNVDVEYDEITWKITGLQLTRKTKCTYFFVEKEEWTFDYNGTNGEDGSYQEFIVPKTGNYKIELWGPSSGNYGSYVAGSISLTSDDTLYVYVGAYSSGCSSYGSCTGAGYNGGGEGLHFVGSSKYPGRWGGISGATDVRFFGNGYEPTASDLTWNSTLGLRNRIMVAGGSTYGYTANAPAGGLSGYTGTTSANYRNGTGGTQTSGGTNSASSSLNGKFGIGGNYYLANPSLTNNNGATSGAGGYYGGAGGYGGSSSQDSSGGSGSSFISGHTGCVAITSSSDQTPKSGCSTGTTDNECSIHYSGLKFTNTKMIDGKGYPWTNIVGTTYEKMPNPSGGYYEEGKGHSGNGYAKITYLGE